MDEEDEKPNYPQAVYDNVAAALGYEVNDDRIDSALFNVPLVLTNKQCKAKLNKLETVFEANGGRGIELAEQIDDLRIVIAVRETGRYAKENTMQEQITKSNALAVKQLSLLGIEVCNRLKETLVSILRGGTILKTGLLRLVANSSDCSAMPSTSEKSRNRTERNCDELSHKGAAGESTWRLSEFMACCHLAP